MMEIKENVFSLKRIRWAIFAFYFSQGLVFASWASRIPDIKSSLGVNDAVFGTMLLMISLGQGIGMTMSGFLVSKFGSKKVLISALPLYAFMLLPIGLVANKYWMMSVLVCYGIFGNFLNIAVNTQGVNIETLYKKSIMSSFHGGWSIAGFVGSMIGLLMINIGFTPFWHFLIVDILIISILAINYKFLPLDRINDSSSNENVHQSKRPEKFLYLLGLVAFSAMFVEGTMFDWSGIYFQDIVKAPHSLIPLGFAGFMVMMSTGRFVADKYNERFGRRRVIQVCGVFIALGLLLTVSFPHIIITTVAFMIVGLGVSSIVPSVYSLAGSRTRISTGLALTIVSSVSFIGFLLGPPIIGYISHATSLRYSYAFVALFAILIIVLVSNIKVFQKDK